MQALIYLSPKGKLPLETPKVLEKIENDFSVLRERKEPSGWESNEKERETDRDNSNLICVFFSPFSVGILTGLKNDFQ